MFSKQESGILRETIAEAFNETELRSLCTDLGIDYEELNGTSKEDKVRELVGYFSRRRDTPKLLQYLTRERPRYNWNTFKKATLGNQKEFVYSDSEVSVVSKLVQSTSSVMPNAPQRKGKTRWLWVLMLLTLLITISIIGLLGWNILAKNQQRSILVSPSQSVPSEGVPSQATCENAVSRLDFEWEQGKSDDSQYAIIEHTIAITAGAETIQDAGGVNPMTAPLLTCPIQGNFIAQVALDYDGGPKCCRRAGFGLRAPGDNTTWLRIDKDSRDYAINSSGLIHNRTKKAEIDPEKRPHSPGGERIWFQIERQEGIITMRYSYDGENWLDYYTYSDIPLPEEVELFLMAEAAYFTPKTTAIFSNFTVERP